MARPLQTSKRTVELAAEGPRVSRIRRDPPPPAKAKQLTIHDRNERDTRIVVIGVFLFALAIFVVVIGVGGWTGWKPGEYEIHVSG